MIKRFSFYGLLIAIGLAAAFTVTVALAQENTESSDSCDDSREICIVNAALKLPIAIDELPKPEPEIPTWLAAQSAPVQTGGVTRPISGSVTYSVETRGNITTSLSQFKQFANQTLNDSRGWSRLGVSFQEVPSGGSFTLVLSEASQVPSFAPGGCSDVYSCRVGRYVIINQDRWVGATPSWNSAGGSLRDYQHMVVNHETGHWLGHGHGSCGGPGQPASLMQQQSISLQGCTFNAWPLPNELYSPTLGR